MWEDLYIGAMICERELHASASFVVPINTSPTYNNIYTYNNYIIVMDLLHDSSDRYPLHDTVCYQALHHISWHFISKASKGQ